MTFRLLLTLKALACLCAAPVLLAAPGFYLRTLGGAPGAAEAFPIRQYGAAVAGVFVLCWAARTLDDARARRIVLALLLVYDALGAAVTAQAVQSGALNGRAWGIAAAYAFFAASAGWLLRRERSIRPRSG